MGKRLFMAVDVDERTREKVGQISKDVRQELGSVKASWVRPDRMHLTLYFCGSADLLLEQRLRDALSQPIAAARFELTFGGLGCFPERGSPRVVWLGVMEGAGTLCRVQYLLADRLDRDAAPRDSRESFSPHLTLARVKEPIPRARMAHLGHIEASAGPSLIDRVTLYESRLSPQGPTYVPLAAALLQP